MDEIKTKDDEFSEYLTGYFKGSVVTKITSVDGEVTIHFDRPGPIDDPHISFRLRRHYEGTPPLYGDTNCHHIVGMAWA